jgi:N6-adenosine-specific RNA methylase IME4
LKERLREPSEPTNKYSILYADPPWSYGDSRSGLQNYSAAVDHYPSMSIKALCDLPVKEWVERDSVLFLWVTSPLLAECWPVIDAWGFQYKASFVWDKVKHNYGHYNSVRHELLLICTRGSCQPESKDLLDSVVQAERGEHSVKPEVFRDIIDQLYPSGRRLEMFARTTVEGWDAWGAECGNP